MAIMDSSMNYVSPVPIPPGETLKETLAAKGMTQSDLALRTGRPKKTINGIIQGEIEITADTAAQLEYALNIPAYIWLNLESSYQTSKVRQREREQIAAESSRARFYPFAEMAKLGWVTATRDTFEKIKELKRFFGVASLESIPAVEATAFRRSEGTHNSQHAIAAWLRKGELEAQKIDTSPFNESGFKKALLSIKRLAYEMPKDFGVKLQDICRECGVAVVYVPHLKGTHANGATRWLTPDKALIQLSIRYPFEDVLWFTFFHEAGHILLHGKRDFFIDYANFDGSVKEEAANSFASKMLIGHNEYDLIKNSTPFTANKIQSLAKQLSISPGIIVGRLHHDELEPDILPRFGKLRKKLVWAYKN